MTITPRRHRLADSQLSSLPTLAKFQLVFRRLCDVLCRSSCPFEHTLTASVHFPSISPVDIMYFKKFVDIYVLYNFAHTGLYRVEVRLGLHGANARLIVSPLSLSPYHPPTPSPSRWSALPNLPPLAKFQLVWRRLCAALPSSSFLARQKHPSLLSCLV